MKLTLALIACLALAAPVASARPVEQFLEPETACEQQWARAYGTPAPASCEQQVLASRGTGSPAEPAVAASDAPSVPSTDSGFDWGAAAAGAGAAGALALVGWSVLAVSHRRVRTAR
jgi:hypothetical protein